MFIHTFCLYMGGVERVNRAFVGMNYLSDPILYITPYYISFNSMLYPTHVSVSMH